MRERTEVRQPYLLKRVTLEPQQSPDRGPLQGDQGEGGCKWPCPAALPHSWHFPKFALPPNLGCGPGIQRFLWTLTCLCLDIHLHFLFSAILLALFFFWDVSTEPFHLFPSPAQGSALMCVPVMSVKILWVIVKWEVWLAFLPHLFTVRCTYYFTCVYIYYLCAQKRATDPLELWSSIEMLGTEDYSVASSLSSSSIPLTAATYSPEGKSISLHHSTSAYIHSRSYDKQLPDSWFTLPSFNWIFKPNLRMTIDSWDWNHDGIPPVMEMAPNIGRDEVSQTTRVKEWVAMEP